LYYPGANQPPPFDLRNAQHFQEVYDRAEIYTDKKTSTEEVCPQSSLLLLLTSAQSHAAHSVDSTSIIPVQIPDIRGTSDHLMTLLTLLTMFQLMLTT
jgi:hypothetical protein